MMRYKSSNLLLLLLLTMHDQARTISNGDVKLDLRRM